MKKIARSYVEAMRDELSLYDVTVEVVAGGKHEHGVLLTAPDGRTLRKPVSGSPRCDEKSMVNIARQEARRYLRAWGLRA